MLAAYPETYCRCGYPSGGADTFTLQRILGHSTLEMTRHYAEVSDGDVEIKQKMFSPAERLEIKV